MAELDGEHGSRLTHAESVDHHREPRTVPQVQEVEGRGHRGQHRVAVRIEPQLLQHRRTDAVVTSELAPERCHNNRSGGAVVHCRVTVTSRKCVAHEMQGSWLRTACSLLHVNSSSVRSSEACTVRRMSASIVIWFCDVGGTIRASAMDPSGWM